MLMSNLWGSEIITRIFIVITISNSSYISSNNSTVVWQNRISLQTRLEAAVMTVLPILGGFEALTTWQQMQTGTPIYRVHFCKCLKKWSAACEVKINTFSLKQMNKYVFSFKYEINQIFYFGIPGHFGQVWWNIENFKYFSWSWDLALKHLPKSSNKCNRKNKISQIYQDKFKMMTCFEANG